jgi:[ribosomal protein S5]-alanine N-acetyltransferase
MCDGDLTGQQGTMAPATLTTPRLRLRAFTPADFDWLHPISSDPTVTRYTDWGPNEPPDTRAFLDEASRSRHGPDAFSWAVTLADGTGIGSAGVEVTSREHRRASFGYVLAPRHWGRGYATEVATALVAFARTSLEVHRVEATCDPDNEASGRVLEKAGLRLEGRLRGHLLVRGSWRDSLLYAALPGDLPRAP